MSLNWRLEDLLWKQVSICFLALMPTGEPEFCLIPKKHPPPIQVAEGFPS
jgi:hypothetical protein